MFKAIGAVNQKLGLDSTILEVENEDANGFVTNSGRPILWQRMIDTAAN